MRDWTDEYWTDEYDPVAVDCPRYYGVGLVGEAGVGKTTLARLLADRLGLAVASFAGILKADLASLDVLKGDPLFREMAVAYGDGKRQKHGAAYWVGRLAEAHDGLDGLIVDDVRKVIEAETLAAGSMLVRLHASDAVRSERLGGDPSSVNDAAFEPACDDRYADEYDLTIDTGRMAPEEAADLVAYFYHWRG